MLKNGLDVELEDLLEIARSRNIAIKRCVMWSPIKLKTSNIIKESKKLSKVKGKVDLWEFTRNFNKQVEENQALRFTNLANHAWKDMQTQLTEED